MDFKMLPLTKGSIEQILKGEQVANPIVQILKIVPIASSDSHSCHYRLEISDGEMIHQLTSLSKRSYHLVKDEIIDVYSVIKLKEYILTKSNINQGIPQNLLIIFSLDVLIKGDRIPFILGQPEEHNDSLKTEFVESNSLTPQPKNIDVKKEACLNKDSSAKIKIDLEKIKSTSVNGKTLLPISLLNASSKNWIIKAKVVDKLPITIWTKANTEISGPMFSMKLEDKHSSIRVRVYNDEVNQFFYKCQEGKTYYVSGAEVMLLTNRINNTTDHAYDLKFRPHTKVTPCTEEEEEEEDDHDDEEEEEVSLQVKNYKFIPLGNIINLIGVQLKDCIDVLGVIKNLEEPGKVLRNNREIDIRRVTLIDQTEDEITLALWSKAAIDFEANIGDIIAIKYSKVAECKQVKTLSTTKRHFITLNPDIPEAQSLRQWYQVYTSTNDDQSDFSEAASVASAMETRWCSLSKGIDRSIQSTNMPISFICKATINFTYKKIIVIKTCPSVDCLEEIVETNGKYTCYMCETDWDNYNPYLSAMLTVYDWSSVIYAVASNDVIEDLIGLSAVEVEQLQRDDKIKFIKKLADVSYKTYQLTLRIKYGQQRSYASVVGVNPVDYKAYTTYCLEQETTLLQKI